MKNIVCADRLNGLWSDSEVDKNEAVEEGQAVVVRWTNYGWPGPVAFDVTHTTARQTHASLNIITLTTNQAKMDDL